MVADGGSVKEERLEDRAEGGGPRHSSGLRLDNDWGIRCKPTVAVGLFAAAPARW